MQIASYCMRWLAHMPAPGVGGQGFFSQVAGARLGFVAASPGAGQSYGLCHNVAGARLLSATTGAAARVGAVLWAVV